MQNLNTVPSNGTYGAAIALINQNFTLVKEQLEHLLYMREGFCGMYETSAALSAAHPNPVAGSFAYVGSVFPMAVYMVSNGSWYATQETYDGGDIDLTQYATSTALTALAGRVTALEGAGYQFAGVASPAASINLNGNTSKIFLLAFASGTYTNYGGLTLSDGEIGVLYFNGSTWSGSKATDIMAKGIVGGYDETPTEDSEKPVTSGGVYEALSGLRQEFDEELSEVNPQFATGEEVGDVSIVTRPGSGTSAVMTQAAVSETVFNEIDIDDIDDIIFNGGQLTPNPAFAGSESGVPAYYTVYDGTSHKLKVGVMSVISDNMGHVVTQMMATHYVLDDSGQITGAHSDSDLFLIYRSAKLSGGTLPTEVGDWTPWNYVNNSLLTNAIASIRTDLLGYYLKTETYSKEQVNALIDAINQFEYAVVAQLPTASSSTRHRIYLVPSTNPDTSNVKDEFITITTTQNGVIRYSWEQIGSTTVDLSGYSTTTQMNAAISSAVSAEAALRIAADNLLDGRVTALEEASASLQESIDGEVIARENAVTGEAALREDADGLLDGRVGTLEDTIAAADDVPTAGSENLVKSGGVYEAVAPVTDNIDMFTVTINTLYNLGLINASDGSITAPGNGHYHYSDRISVSPGDKFSITNLNAYSNTFVVAMYANNDPNKPADTTKSIKGIGVQYDDDNIVIPEGIYYISVCYSDNAIGDVSAPVIKKVGNFDYLSKEVEALNERPGDVKDYVNALFTRELDFPKKKPCVVFQMDLGSASVNSDCVFEFAKRLIALNIYPTFFAVDSYLTARSIENLKRLQAMGCEIGIHSDEADKIGQGNGAPYATVSDLKYYLEHDYFPALMVNGLFPVGWVTSHGLIHNGPTGDLATTLKDYFLYGHTTSNGAYDLVNFAETDGFNPSYVNTLSTDKIAIQRWGLDVSKVVVDSQPTYPTNEYVLNAAKKGVDLVIANNGLLVLYCHSLKITNATFTLTEEVFSGILSYIEDKIRSGVLVSGTTADVVKYYYDRKEADIKELKGNLVTPTSFLNKLVRKAWNTSGVISTVSASSWQASALIPIENNTSELTLYNVHRYYSGNLPFVVFFDSQRRFISSIMLTDNEEEPYVDNRTVASLVVPRQEAVMEDDAIPEGVHVYIPTNAKYYAVNFNVGGYTESIDSSEQMNKTINDIKDEVDGLKDGYIPIRKCPGKAVTKTGTVYSGVSDGATPSWCMTQLIPLKVFDSAKAIILNGCHCYGSYPFVAFFDEDKAFISYLAEGKGEHITKTVTLTQGDGGNVPQNAKYIIANLVNNGYIENLEPPYSSDDVYISNIAYAVSWVDDDLYISSNSNYGARGAKAYCDELGCKCDFAAKPENIASNLETYILPWQQDGFHFQLHPTHEGWYGNSYEGREYVEQSLIDCISAFKDAGMEYDSSIVYPGSSGQNAEVVDMVKDWLDFGITASSPEGHNVGMTNKYALKRLMLNKKTAKDDYTPTISIEGVTSNDDYYSIEYYKGKIDDAYTAKAWLIIGTHSATFTGPGLPSSADGLPWAAVKEIIRYAAYKGGSPTALIQPIKDVLKKKVIIKKK